jgi:hypothetical protein
MSKAFDVSQAQAIWPIFRVLGRLENCSVLRTVEHPWGCGRLVILHLIEIGIADGGEQAAVLIFPADLGLSWCLDNRRLHDYPVNSTISQVGL